MAAREHISKGALFGSLSYVCDVPHVKGVQRRAIFRCACGSTIESRITHVKSGRTNSCGCLIAKKNKARSTHGHAGRGNISTEYNSWSDMRKRCQNSAHKFYKHYGGRGIKVCNRWQSFDLFLADMGSKPGPEYSIDRIENDGNYEPGNCRWATQQEQTNNRRITPMVSYQGRTQSIANWARDLGFGYWSLRKRLVILKWPIDRAFTTPMVIGRNQFD